MIIKRTIKFSIRNYRDAGYRIRMRVHIMGIDWISRQDL